MPLHNERDRYSALDDSGTMMMIDGECGWEAYTKLLLVQHNELQEWMRRNIPPERIKADGTFKPQFALPAGITLGSKKLYVSTTVEALVNRYNSDKATWRCANPNDRFAIRK